MEREREIRAFVPEESWKLTSLLENDIPLAVELAKANGKKFHAKTEDDVRDFLKSYGIADLAATATFSKDKKGNKTFTLPHSVNFTLRESEKKNTKRLP